MSIPGKLHYNHTYIGNNYERLISYQAQLQYATSYMKDPKILIVGKGDGLIQEILFKNGYEADVLDINKELSPDILGSVDDIPIESNSYDITLCCQVLEHLPFERFQLSIKELYRVTKHKVVISLPDVRRFISFRIQLFRYSFSYQISFHRLFPKKISNIRFEKMGHYWEIGYKGYPLKKILALMQIDGWSVINTTRIYDLPWHLFIELEKGR